MLKVLDGEMFPVHHHDIVLLNLARYLRHVLRLLAEAGECRLNQEILIECLERLVLLRVVILIHTQYAQLLVLTYTRLVILL